ncbi:sulfurtransferase TusA family protein [Pacificibacter sp. AS14]|uniref:sulfurtransferase TusA family protein n=1 Tax=Pacificibacter sp. AS14 TaxID=3135785 RepID=UPI0031706648
MNWDQDIDAIGLLCPLPVLKARKRLLAMKTGEVLRLVASDPAAVIDVPHFCAEAGHLLLAQTAADDALSKLSPNGTAQFYFIKRG